MAILSEVCMNPCSIPQLIGTHYVQIKSFGNDISYSGNWTLWDQLFFLNREVSLKCISISFLEMCP